MIQVEFPSRHIDFPMEDYHKKVEALSRSDIVRLLRSPLHFKSYVRPDIETPFFRVGKALHSVTLEGIQPIVNDHDGRTKKGKEFQAENPKSIPAKDAKLVEDMHKQVKGFFRGDRAEKSEVSFFWTENFTEGLVRCKCRPDWIEDGVIYDLKTTRRDARNFRWDIKDYSLDIQAAWYLRGVSRHEPVYAFRFVVVEKESPHGVMVYEIEKLDAAREKIAEALDSYRHCNETNEWPGYDIEIREI